MQTKTFHVEGMRCEHCKAKVEKALQGIDGITAAEANVQEANVRIEYDESRVSCDDMRDAVEDAGFGFSL